MFEDIIPADEDDEKQMKLYICEFGDKCLSLLCLHKDAHGKTELGRPAQPENEDPCDCSQVPCNYHPIPAICKPI